MKGARQNDPPPKTDEDTWLVQKREDETPEDILQLASKRRLQVEITQEKTRNEENNLELRVVPPVEHNSYGLLPETDDMAVALPQERKDNSTPESEDNPSIQKEKEVDSSQPCDTIPTPIRRGEEEKTVSACPQRNKSPPAWLGDFVTGGELD